MSPPSPHQPRPPHRVNERQWQAILAATSDGFWALDREGRIIEVNDAYIRMVGYSREELLTMAVPDLEAIESPEETVRHIQKVLADRFDRFQTRHRTKDGRFIDVEVTAVHVPEDQVFIGFLRDITAQKVAERQLARSRALAETLVQSASALIVGVDPEGRIRLFNPCAERVTGYALAEVLDRNWFDLLTPPDALPDVRREFERLMNGGTPGLFEAPILTRSGERRLVSWSSSVLRDAEGGFAGLAIGVDVTDRRQAEESLRSSEHFLRRMIDNAPLGILRYRLDTDDTLRFQGGNPTAERMLGLSLAASVDKPILDVFPGLAGSDVPDNFVRIARDGGSFARDQIDYHEENISGAYEFVAFQTVPDQIAVFFTDITERKVNELELIRAREEAVRANQAKDEFLGVMSHELRTPLTPIFGFTEMLSVLTENPEHREFLSHIDEAAKRMLRLIDDLLSFTRLTHKPIQPLYIPFSPRVFFRRSVRRAQTYCRDNRLSLDEETLAGTSPFPPSMQVVSDPEMVGQVVSNLLTNACKFTHGGSVTLRFGLENQGTGRERLRFEVEDTGIGIPPESLETIWAPFSQVDSSATRAYEGIGLGLAICRRIVASLGGEIGVDSRAGEGSRFWVWVPIQLIAAGQGDDEAGTVDGVKLQNKLRGRVLLVEDNPMNRLTLLAQLQLHGVESIAAEDGELALELLENEGPRAFDLILMDLHLPEPDGVATVHRIRELFPLAALPPIVALSADCSERARRQSRACGMIDFLEKPVRLKDLTALLDRHLARPSGLPR